MKTVRSSGRVWPCVVLAPAMLLWGGTAAAQVAPAPTEPPASVTALTSADVHDAAAAATAPPGASGQPVTAGLESLRLHLGSGDRVTLVRTDGSAASGKIVRIGASELDLRAETHEPGERQRKLTVTIPFEVIESLERPRDSTKNGALIGAGVGAGVGIALFAHAYAIDANEMDEWAGSYTLGALVMTGLGALVGWAIDAAHSKPRFRYERPTTGGPDVRLVPLATNGKGLALVVSF